MKREKEKREVIRRSADHGGTGAMGLHIEHPCGLQPYPFTRWWGYMGAHLAAICPISAKNVNQLTPCKLPNPKGAA
jgi:hypothetical protein